MPKIMIDNTVYLTSDSIFVDYFADEDKEMKETCSDFSNIIHGLTDFSQSFELSVTVSKDTWLTILGVKDAILDVCQNKRVVHLAKHGSKKTRKKNFHRAIRILEER